MDKVRGMVMPHLFNPKVWIVIVIFGLFPPLRHLVLSLFFAGLGGITGDVISGTNDYLNANLANLAELAVAAFGVMLLFSAIRWHERHPLWALVTLALFAFVAAGGWSLVARSNGSLGHQLYVQAQQGIAQLGKG